MVARLLRSNGGAPGVQYFGIRPEEDHLVLRGNNEEASSVVVKGFVVLCTTKPLKIQDISLRLTGEARTSFSYLTAASSMRLMRQDTEFLKHKWQFDVLNSNAKQGGVIPAGNYEWPFDFILSGDLPESVEGHSSSWIVYRLKAVIDRGLFAKDLEARRHIRLIRTFDPSSLELSQNTSLINCWPNKISYNISSPSKGVALGSAVTVDFQLIPLLKGLRIGRIQTVIVETVALTVENKGETSRTLKTGRNVVVDEYRLPEDFETQDVDGSEGYLISRSIQLPRSLRNCLQSVNEMNISISHQLKFNVGLHNPDGHLSELRASLPIIVFIAPHMRLNDDNEIDTSLPHTAATLEEVAAAPPGYGDHCFDALYTELESHSYITPGQSQPQSRRGSDGDGDDEADITEADRELAANTLRNRLADLQIANQAQAATDPSQNASDGTAAEHNHTPLSVEDEQDPPRNLSFGGPQHVEYDTEALSRIPSYNTALHSSTQTPIAPDLPNYNAATSTVS